MRELGLRLSMQIPARVERSNRTLQDRLIKGLRREGISLKSKNSFILAKRNLLLI
jgi:hypothetical protein